MRVANMKEFFETTEFGKELKQVARKTSKRYHGQQVYEITEKLPKYGLKKEDQIYLDALHADHLEVFSNKNARTVLNLDGSENIDKGIKAEMEKRTI